MPFAGLEDVDQGAIFVADRNIIALAPRERTSRWCSRTAPLYPHTTVYENMAFALKLRHTPKREIEQPVKTAAA